MGTSASRDSSPSSLSQAPRRFGAPSSPVIVIPGLAVTRGAGHVQVVYDPPRSRTHLTLTVWDTAPRDWTHLALVPEMYALRDRVHHNRKAARIYVRGVTRPKDVRALVAVLAELERLHYVTNYDKVYVVVRPVLTQQQQVTREAMVDMVHAVWALRCRKFHYIELSHEEMALPWTTAEKWVRAGHHAVPSVDGHHYLVMGHPQVQDVLHPPSRGPVLTVPYRNGLEEDMEPRGANDRVRAWYRWPNRLDFVVDVFRRPWRLGDVAHQPRQFWNFVFPLPDPPIPWLTPEGPPAARVYITGPFVLPNGNATHVLPALVDTFAELRDRGFVRDDDPVLAVVLRLHNEVDAHDVVDVYQRYRMLGFRPLLATMDQTLQIMQTVGGAVHLAVDEYVVLGGVTVADIVRFDPTEPEDVREDDGKDVSGRRLPLVDLAEATMRGTPPHESFRRWQHEDKYDHNRRRERLSRRRINWAAFAGDADANTSANADAASAAAPTRNPDAAPDSA